MYTATDPQTATKFRLDTGVNSSAISQPIAYALVLVPEGYDSNDLNYPATTTDLYNPTANVLISGVITDATVEDHKSSRYSRKMKTGDRIALLYYNAGTTAVPVSFEINFTTIH